LDTFKKLKFSIRNRHKTARLAWSASGRWTKPIMAA
jgi:hypothetical protein